MAQHWIATRPGDLGVFALEDHDLTAPGPGEVTIEVRAAGMNPADAKHVAAGKAEDFPRPIGYEVAGVVTAVGPDTEIGSGPVAVGDDVLAFRISGGWATALTVPAKDVFAKPASLSWGEAANLLLVGCTASEMLHVTGVGEGDTILVHGASGAVGVSVLQQAALLGATAIGTASEGSFETVRRFGGQPVAYGDGLEQRVRDLAPDGVAAALDCVGTDEAVDVSLALRARSRPHRDDRRGWSGTAGRLHRDRWRDAGQRGLSRLRTCRPGAARRRRAPRRAGGPHLPPGGRGRGDRAAHGGPPGRQVRARALSGAAHTPSAARWMRSAICLIRRSRPSQVAPTSFSCATARASWVASTS